MSDSSASPSRRRRVLITGGLGFIGSHIAAALHQDYDLVILDWDEPSQSAAQISGLNVPIHRGDIADPNTWRDVDPCDFVFHAAAQVSAVASESDPVRDFRTNVQGTFLVAEYARQHRASVIYCNSIRVYDPDAIIAAVERHGVVSENCPTVDAAQTLQSPFALSKLVGEEVLMRYSRMHKIRVISHRMGGIVGPGQVGSNQHAWLSYLIGCAVDGTEFTIYGDGQQVRDVLHISDLVDLIAMEFRDFDRFAQGRDAIYNVGGGRDNAMSMRGVIEILERDYGLKGLYKYADPRLGEPKRYISGIDRIRAKGWSPKYNDPRRVIEELVIWHKRGDQDGAATKPRKA